MGVLVNDAGRVLIAQRRAGTAGAGKWEFPGGKCESRDGDVTAALARELDEELGIQLLRSRPLLRFHHDYSEQRVLLDIWRVLEWRGEAYGREGQKLVWAAPEKLLDYELLSANKPIVDAICLPDSYALTPDLDADAPAFMDQAERLAEGGQRLLRLRSWDLPDPDYEALASALIPRLRRHNAGLMIDRDEHMLDRLDAAGLHLPAHRLAALRKRGVPQTKWFAVSCHNRAGLLQAKLLGADFAVLSPVCQTHSHPEKSALGWPEFSAACEHIAMPVYAMGGLGPADAEKSWAYGAQGVAGISGFWSQPG